MNKNKLITHILNEDKESYEKDSLEMINEITIFGFDPFKDNLLDLGVQKADKWLAKTGNALANKFINMFTAEGRLSNKMEKFRNHYLKLLKVLEKQKAIVVDEALKSKNYKNLEDIEEKNDIVKNINDEIKSYKFFIATASRYIKIRKNIFGSSYGNEDDENSKISPQLQTELKKEDTRIAKLTAEILDLENKIKTGSVSSETSGTPQRLINRRKELATLLGIVRGSSSGGGSGSGGMNAAK